MQCKLPTIEDVQVPPAMVERMKAYSVQLKKKHPSMTPKRLMTLVAKKYNVTLLT